MPAERPHGEGQERQEQEREEPAMSAPDVRSEAISMYSVKIAQPSRNRPVAVFVLASGRAGSTNCTKAAKDSQNAP